VFLNILSFFLLKMKRFNLLFYLLLFTSISYSQSDLQNILRGGEIIVNGLSFLN
jgi:hypothetical protein